MADRQLKFGAALLGVGGPGQHDTWLSPEIPGDASVDIGWYAERARELEDARFDFVFIVDSQFITPDSPPHYLNRLEPLTLLSALAVTTSRIGLVGTITTSFNSPFNVARRLGSLDVISRGRAGWNVVTSGDSGTAGNYSLDEHYDYATRYGRALEHVTVARGLWDSYEDDAFPRDKEREVFFDRSRQHALNHRGEHFSVVGPLNLERSPQGHPVIFQAGDSEEGRELGAQVGEGIFTIARSFEESQVFSSEMKQRAVAKGRAADDILIFPALSVRLADSDEEAWRLVEQTARAKDFSKSLAQLGRPFGWHDFSQYDLDAPFPDVDGIAEKSFRTQAEDIVRVARERALTLRETVEYVDRMYRTPFAGTPETVAGELERWFTGGAADGFILMVNLPSELRRFTAEVLPILQARGLFRTDYESGTLRGNLGLGVPENVHTAARAAAQRTQAERAEEGALR
ncbi:MAG: NtaA/DmoA family FMN-dependent monooxygenase [Actinomycetota bacterium]|nr:NtaA/DmoA family FMN-dependent monooxygenase [Actinomycetota bacterium]